jgi:hypothetical protein
MQQISRRDLIKLAGVGTVLLAGAGLATAGRALWQRPESIRFRATLGLPQPPLPSYATYVVEGALDRGNNSGQVSSRVMAAGGDIGLPGLGRVVTVTGIEERGNQLAVRGVIEDRSQLQPGESDQVRLVIDRARGTVEAPFGGRGVTLRLS